MKIIKCLFLIITVIICASSDDCHEKWIKFKSFYRKNYTTTEEVRRRELFKQNMALIERNTYLYENGLVQFLLDTNCAHADLSDEELKDMGSHYNSLLHKTIVTEQFQSNKTNSNLPTYIDWRHLGAVTSVENIKNCSASYAISAVNAVETQYYLKTTNLIKLSAQQIIDCSGRSNDCIGGFIDDSFDYIIENGIVTDVDYPYVDKQQTCGKMNESLSPFKISDYVRIKPNQDNDLMTVLAEFGTVAAAVNAYTINWLCYKTGVLYDDKCRSDVTDLDHSVVVVGYGTEGGHDYWLCKNSWGLNWGELGYIKLARNHGNHCGITTSAFLPRI